MKNLWHDPFRSTSRQMPRPYGPLLLLAALSCLWAIAFSMGQNDWSRSVRAGETDQVTTVRHERASLRRPIALALDGAVLLVANRDAGTVSLVDVAAQKVLSEIPVGARPADVAVLPESGTVLVLDEQSSELIVAHRTGRRLHIRQRLTMPVAPVDIAVSKPQGVLAIASLWGQCVSLMTFSEPTANANPALKQSSSPELTVTDMQTVPLPFCPREQWFGSGGQWLVVADAHSGQLAVIDVPRRQLHSVRSFQANNIRGLTLSPEGDELLVTQQMMNGQVPTERNQVFWGTVMSNVVRGIPLQDLFAPNRSGIAADQVEPITHWSLHPLGHSGRAAGDPGDIVVTAAGEYVVSLSGVDEIAWRNSTFESFQRAKVGVRPTDLELAPDQRTVYIANTHSDSVSVFSLDKPGQLQTISLGPMRPLTIVERGELLFYDAHLSLDGWFSCHSCHTDGHTNNDLSDNFGDESYGAPKRVPSLLGVDDTGPWGWLGNRDSLTEQIRTSILKTMHGKEDQAGTETVAAISAYIRSLAPPPAVTLRESSEASRERVARGRKLFDRLDCRDCHQGAQLTSETSINVGLEDEVGNMFFNPPSLRGVGQRQRLLHDGRAESLRSVIADFGHYTTETLSDEELDDLVMFLRSL